MNFLSFFETLRSIIDMNFPIAENDAGRNKWKKNLRNWIFTTILTYLIYSDASCLLICASITPNHLRSEFTANSLIIVLPLQAAKAANRKTENEISINKIKTSKISRNKHDDDWIDECLKMLKMKKKMNWNETMIFSIENFIHYIWISIRSNFIHHRSTNSNIQHFSIFNYSRIRTKSIFKFISNQSHLYFK